MLTFRRDGHGYQIPYVTPHILDIINVFRNADYLLSDIDDGRERERMGEQKGTTDDVLKEVCRCLDYTESPLI